MARIRPSGGSTTESSTTSESPTTDDDATVVKRVKKRLREGEQADTTVSSSSSTSTTSDRNVVKQVKQSQRNQQQAVTDPSPEPPSDRSVVEQAKRAKRDQRQAVSDPQPSDPQSSTIKPAGSSEPQQHPDRVHEAFRNAEEQRNFRKRFAQDVGVSEEEVRFQQTDSGLVARVTEQGRRDIRDRMRRSVRSKARAVARDRKQSAELAVLTAERGVRRAVARTPEAPTRPGVEAVTPRGGRREMQRRAIEEQLEQANPGIADRQGVGIGTRVEDGRVRATVQRTPTGGLSPTEQDEQAERVIRGLHRKVARTPPKEADLSRVTDVGVLTSTQSPGARFFGTAERERAIEQEAREGSVFAKTFVGAEALEQAGLEGTRFLQNKIPEAPGGAPLRFSAPGVGQVKTGVELNPRVGIGGATGVRAGTQIRKWVTEVPAGVGMVSGFGGKAVGDIGLRAESVLGRDVAPAGTIDAAATKTALGVAGGKTVEGIKEEPIGAALDIVTPFAVSKVSPVGVSRFDVPTGESKMVAKVPTSRKVGAAVKAAQDVRSVGDVRTAASAVRRADISEQTLTGPTTTTRGIRLKTPDVARRFTDRNFRGRTVVGFRGARPTAGAPDVDLQKVALERLGGDKANQGNVFEPQTPFETEVVGASAKRFGGDVAKRVSATRQLVERAETRTGSARRRQVGDVEETVASVEGVPDELAPDVVEVLAAQEATIFGSGAVRAQAPDFRTPGDIDIVVPDKTATKQALAERFEGTDLDVQRTFDIKEASDFGGLERGEVFGFGARSQSPIETERGVRINPIGEELQRKAGASAFLRGGGELTAEFDVGPRANPGGKPRVKDIDDAVAISEELLGPEDASVRRFKQAFDRGDVEVPAPGETPGGVLDGLEGEVRMFLADEAAEFRLAGRKTAVDDVVEPETRRLLDDSPGRASRAMDSPSPSRATRSPSTRPVSASGVVSATASSAASGSADPSAVPGPSPPSGGPSATTSPSSTGPSPVSGSSPPSVSSSVSESRVSSSIIEPSSEVSTSTSTSVGTSSSGSPTISSTTNPVLAHTPPPPPPGISELDDRNSRGRRIGARVASDFEKTFEAEVATEETVAFGDVDTLSDPDAFTEPGGRFVDTDTSPEVVETFGDPTEAELDMLLEGDGGDPL